MQIKTLDGYHQNWSLTGHSAHAKLKNKSSLHISAREVLKESYPTLHILEEVPVPIKKTDTLYFDFFIPILKTVVEVHGEQHYKFVPFYHSTMLGFLKSKKRDLSKIEWCDLNQIKYIEFPYNENLEQWKSRLNDAR